MEKTSLVKIWEEEDEGQLWTMCSTLTSGMDWEVAVMIAPPNRSGWSVVDVDATNLVSRAIADENLATIQEHLKNIGYRLNNDHVKWRWKYDQAAESFRMNLRAPKIVAPLLEEE